MSGEMDGPAPEEPAGVEFDKAMPFGYAVRYGHIYLREFRPVCTTCGRTLVLRDGLFRCPRHSLVEVRAPMAARPIAALEASPGGGGP